MMISYQREPQTHILVVNPHLPTRKHLADMLMTLGFEVLQASEAREALAMFSRIKPWLVITDILLGDSDGFDMVHRIRQKSAERFVPVLFVTQSDNQTLYERCLDAGGDDVLQGPVSLAVLRVKLVSMQRITGLYHEVKGLHDFLRREEEVAEELLSGAIEGANVATEQLYLYKKPASTFSGDVLLTAWRPDGDLNVMLGDFTGHGLTSVIGALPLAETFRAMSRKGYQGDEILRNINRKLKALLPPGMFLATLMVQVSRDDARVWIWNCGMPDALVFSPGLSEPQCRIESADPPLGIMADFIPLPAKCLTVAEGDRILLTSDGVLEARSPEGEMFSEQRLIEAACKGMRRGQLAEEVMAAAEQFMAGCEQDDDVSLIEIPAWLEARVAPARVVSQPEVSDTLEMADVAEDELASDGDFNWSLTLQGTMLRKNPVPMLISQLQEMFGEGEHWQTAFTIITELYVNALDHGVLQLDSTLKSSPEGFAIYFTLREERLAALQQGEVQISLNCRLHTTSGGQLDVMIRDSGNGFDSREFVDDGCCQPEQPVDMELCGRGICLIKDLAHSLTYHEGGRCAKAVLRW